MTFAETRPVSIHPGDHVLWMFGSDADWGARLLAWSTEGLEQLELILVVGAGRPDDLIDLLESEGLDGEAMSERGQIGFVSLEELAMSEGRLDLDGLARRLHTLVDAAANDQMAGGVRLLASPAEELRLIGELGAAQLHAAFEELLPSVAVSLMCALDTRGDVKLARTLAKHHSRRLLGPLLDVARVGGTVRLVGELDTSNAHLLGTAVERALGAADRVTIDLTDLDFIDAAGLKVIELADRGDSGRLAVTGTSPHQTRLFGVVELSHLLKEGP